MRQAIQSFIQLITSVIESIVHFFTYLPKLFEFVQVASDDMLEMFNYLPSWIFAIGSITIAIAVIWIIVEII